MLFGFCAILICQVLGEVISFEAKIPIPGPVLGMLLMVGLLSFLGRPTIRASKTLGTEISECGGFILRNLSLLFIPAGVGMVQKLDIITAHGLGLVVTVVGSTVITLVVTVLAFLATSRVFGLSSPNDNNQ